MLTSETRVTLPPYHTHTPYVHTHRGQAYVAAFLTKSDKGSTGVGGEESTATSSDKDKSISSRSSDQQQQAVSAEVVSAADSLYEVGTFAQVHTMMSGDSPDSAQLLLLGHRRIKREATVSAVLCCVGCVCGCVSWCVCI